MVLAVKVNNLHGHLLLAAGCQLTPRQIGVLQAWGVAEVEVVSSGAVPQPGDEVKDSALSPAIRLELQKLFRRQDFSYPVIRELFEACATRKARREYRPATA